MLDPTNGNNGDGPKVLDQVVRACKTRHYSAKTAKTYRQWARDYIYFHKNRMGRFVHPRDIGAQGIEAYLTYLAVERRVAASTQNQAGRPGTLPRRLRQRSKAMTVQWHGA